MRILSEGRADTISSPVNVYAIDRNNKTVVISGNFSGASVTVQYSSDKNTWNDVVNAVNITEKTAGTMYSFTGWIRVVIEGGIPYVTPKEPPFIWRNGIHYYEGQIVNIQGTTYICTKDHIDGNLPSWDCYELYTYSADSVDNTSATSINVDLI